MFNRRRLSLAITLGACLLVASAASANPLNTFTAARAPTHVKPLTSVSYTISLTIAASAPDFAQRAKVGIPSGFGNPMNVQATTTKAGSCVAATWEADGQLIADGKINLKRPGGNNNALCPGGTLTVGFVALSAAVDGTYKWTSELLNDASGAFTLSGAQPSVVVDGTVPIVTITQKPSNPTNSTSASFAFTSTEALPLECKLDAAAFAPCASPNAYTALAAGAHTFLVRATDAAGNVGEASYGWTIDTTAPTVTIDTTAPETTLASGPEPVTTATSATFTFSASENGSFECRLDGAPFALCGSPKSYGGLGQGDHRFEVRAIDAAGNADATPALHPWKIQAPARKIATSALLAPRGGARVTKPPLLVWRRVARAGYYNVQLFRGKQKILSAWPNRARLRLQARWKFAGRVRRLTPGSYRWYVWPGYGVPSARNYGQLLGESTFVVARSGRR
jgi:hypothetical protein